jgi:hypothetical protein
MDVVAAVIRVVRQSRLVQDVRCCQTRRGGSRVESILPTAGFLRLWVV